jgi:hypothetical protein
MNYVSKHKIITACLSGLGLASTSSYADFFSDSKASIDTKNYYFNRDYREDAGQNQRAEWAQGFTLKFQSGFTDGMVGFGLDATGMLGVKLDSSPDRSGTGILPQNNEAEAGHPSYAKRAPDDYSKLGLTGKAKIHKTDLQVGYLVPDLPTLAPNTSRLFPQSFQGVSAKSQEFNDFVLLAGQIDKVKQRDSTDYEELRITAQNGAYASTATSDGFRYFGGDYSLTPKTTVSYQYAQLEDIYQQHYFGLVNSFSIGPGEFKSELRYEKAAEDGSSNAGKVDNSSISSKFGYGLGGHVFSVGYQKQYGSTPYVYVNGTNSYLFSEYQESNFSQTEERVWLARYDYDFAALGIPGLAFTTKYASGSDARLANFKGEGREWERDIGVSYAVQSGALKGLYVRWLNGNLVSNYTRDINENRLIIGYTVSIW